MVAAALGLSRRVCLGVCSPPLPPPTHPPPQNWDIEFRERDENAQATKHLQFLYENYEPRWVGSRAPPHPLCRVAPATARPHRRMLSI